MSYILDTNACIQYLNGTSACLRRKLESNLQEDIFLCAVVRAELFYGAIKSANAAKNIQKLRHFTDRFTSLPFDDGCTEIYGEIRVQLEKKGKIIGPYDLMIAAIALANKMTLISHNTREFGRIKDLQLEDWETE
jgi:tRNA(fMet)-specific endonuclease VapC